MTIYALCYHYDSFGGDDTAVLGLYSTEEKAFEAGRKREKEAQERWEKISLSHIVKSLRLMGFSFTATAITM